MISNRVCWAEAILLGPDRRGSIGTRHHPGTDPHHGENPRAQDRQKEE
jgi:hypothetical protein